MVVLRRTIYMDGSVLRITQMNSGTDLCIAMAKKRITKKELLRIEQTSVREERKEQGALDGRFREKVEKNKKTYTRKAKHKKKEQ